MTALPDYRIEHTRAYKDPQGKWRAFTALFIDDRKVKILSFKRFDGCFVTTARCSKIEGEFEGGRDWSKELQRIDIAAVTRALCNSYHCAATRDIVEIVKEVATFYEMKGK